MFTLVYLKGKFNRPNSLRPFLQANVGNSPLLQVDCITPYKGTRQELINDVCEHLNQIDPDIQVRYTVTCESESSTHNSGNEINYLVIQIQVDQRN